MLTASAPPPIVSQQSADGADDAAAPRPAARGARGAPARVVPSPGGVSPTALLRATLASTTPLLAADSGATQPAAGLWVLATARCILPAGTDLNAWAECTQPIGLNGGELAVLEKPKAGNKAQLTGGLYSIARTRYRIARLAAAPQAGAPGAPGPAVVQVQVPGLAGRSYVYIAILPEIVDGEGRFVSARAWPVPCPPPGSPGVTRRADRCLASDGDAVIDAASAMPADGGYVLRWIDPTDAAAAGDTGGGRAYAPNAAAAYRPPRKLTPREASEPLPISSLPPDLAAGQPQPSASDAGEGDEAVAPAQPASSRAGANAKAGAKARKRS